jgi:glyoxylase-like metal-dependent hydrolase (beta-lactamase superfamily II)
MAEVIVLIEGENTRDKENKMSMGSSDTLIKSDRIILVDTGSIPAKDRLIQELEKQGLTPEDIDIVVLTHLHLDHMINVHLFNNAKVLCKVRGDEYPGQVHTLAQGCLERTDLFDSSSIAQDVECMLTPGHTDDMVSVLVKTPEGNVVVAGDAFPNEEWTDLNIKPSPLLNLDVEKFNKSRKKILEKADYIIPGHGKMFKVA